ncbi:MAG: EAL domain-containing protein, partial [Pseudomonadota bacterium]
GRMVWGDLFNSENTAWLSNLGFIDFAGATVVHGVGAAAGLMGILMLGPRTGRFNHQGKAQPLAAYNSVIALAGTLILVFCWLGFNGGSLSPSSPLFQMVLMNTLTAAAFGSIAGLIVGAQLDNGIFNPGRIITGIIGGLVACTAAPHLMSTIDAMVVGAGGGALATVSAHWLLHKAKIDDPLDVVASHGVAGIFGTAMVAFVTPVSQLPAGSRLAQFAVQVLGSVALLGFVAAATWAALTIVKHFTRLRVSAEDEHIGLNYTEHGESVGTGRLQQALEARIQGVGSFSDRFNEASNDEHSEIASAMNKLLDKHEEARKNIKLSEKRFQHFAQTASDWLWETDKHLRFLSLNSNSDEKSSDSHELNDFAFGKHLFELLSVTGNDAVSAKRCIKEKIATGTFEANLPALSDEEEILVEVRGVPYYSLTGDFLGYRGTLCDITPRKSAENRAMFLALHDELTGLPNRRALAERIGKILESADHTGLTAVIAGVDLDGFKSINDSYGHAAGDSLLKQVAQRLEQGRRPDDLVFRTGGDEFVIVLTGFEPSAAQSNAESICNRIIENLSCEYLIDTHSATIGASIGIALYPQHSDGSDNLARLADLALYAAKAQGKGQVVAFEPQMDIDAQHRRKLEADLRIAIEEQQFYLAYQPLLCTDSEQIIGFESLIRWNHPERGEIPPGNFIPVAEELHLMSDIGEFVLKEACSFATGWEFVPDEDPLTIAVNVSPDQLRGENFTTTVKQILQDTGLNPARLELEITEDVLVHDFEEVTSILLELRSIGVSIAVDDFGSGQTSLRYLNNFPISKLKIDRSFIRHLGSDSKAEEITRSIVRLGRKLGVSVVAEGVEETRQLKMLKDWDCDQVQGFLFSRPVNSDDAESIVSHAHKPMKKAG